MMRNIALMKRRHICGGDKKRDVHPGNVSNQEDVASFSHDLLVEKKKHSYFHQASVMTRALYILSTIKILITHSQQAGWIHKESDLIHWNRAV